MPCAMHRPTSEPIQRGPLCSESLFTPVGERDRLHLKRFYREPLGAPVLMFHGAIAHGGVFYSRSGRGLAPYLADRGFDVYVVDWRGRGGSVPALKRDADYGHGETICEDIGAVAKRVVEIRGRVPQHWIAHSWGGVLLAAHLARFPEWRGVVRSQVYIASKRYISARNWRKFLNIDLVWNLVCPSLIALFGYLPARELKFAMDNESAKSRRDIARWVKEKGWVDPDDAFDYGDAIKKIDFPPTLYLAGVADAYLGNPVDVKLFMEEVKAPVAEYRVLGTRYGNKADYDHIELLVHPEAEVDHFPQIVEWIRKYDR